MSKSGVAGLTLNGYPALVDKGNSVSLRLFDSPEAAAAAIRAGLVRLFMTQLHKEVNYLEQSIPDIEQLCFVLARRWGRAISCASRTAGRRRTGRCLGKGLMC